MRERLDWRRQLAPEEQLVLDAVADELAGHGNHSEGLLLRRLLTSLDRGAKRQVVNGLAPVFLRRLGSDAFSLMPLGGLRSKHSSMILGIAERLRTQVRAEFEANNRFDRLVWEVVRERASLQDVHIELAKWAFGCLGVWGGSGGNGTYVWERPLPEVLENLLEELPLEDVFAESQRQIISWAVQAAALDGRRLPPEYFELVADDARGQQKEETVVTTSDSPVRRIGAWRVLDESLGRGGQGSVVLAWNENRFIHGALKRLRADKELTEKARTRFLREMSIFKALNHPFILRVLDAGEDIDHELYLVTEVAPFGSLQDNAQVLAGDMWRTLRLVRDIARGLAAVHDAGIVHRDLKPENLLLRSLDHPLVGDFGIAHITQAEGVTSVGERVGNYFYSPREYEMKAEPLPAFDVFSLGAIMHWLLVGGKPPEEPYRVMSNRARLADTLGSSRFVSVDALLDRMLVPDGHGRIQSMPEVIREIDKLLGFC